MNTKALELGGIYQGKDDESTMRVVGFDEFEVFYDCQNDFDGSWTFSGNFKRKSHYYRTSADLFVANSKFIRKVELSDEEFNFFRPDLALRIARAKSLSWNNLNDLQESDLEAISNSKIDTAEIYLVPFGAKGGLMKSQKLVADDGISFSVSELIRKANQVQSAVNKSVSKGIGIYRLGAEKGLPSFYIGEYLDRAGIFSA